MSSRYRPTVNVWQVTREQLATLQIGQWVSAGAPDSERNNCGRFYGVRPSGSVVVAWNGNARGRGQDWRAYHAAVHNFARGR